MQQAPVTTASQPRRHSAVRTSSAHQRGATVLSIIEAKVCGGGLGVGTAHCNRVKTRGAGGATAQRRPPAMNLQHAGAILRGRRRRRPCRVRRRRCAGGGGGEEAARCGAPLQAPAVPPHHGRPRRCAPAAPPSSHASPFSALTERACSNDIASSHIQAWQYPPHTPLSCRAPTPGLDDLAPSPLSANAPLHGQA